MRGRSTLANLALASIFFLFVPNGRRPSACVRGQVDRLAHNLTIPGPRPLAKLAMADTSLQPRADAPQLMRACWRVNATEVSQLLGGGENPNLRDRNGMSALMWLAYTDVSKSEYSDSRAASVRCCATAP